MNENFTEIELGGWNLPETIIVEAADEQPCDFSDFEL